VAQYENAAETEQNWTFRPRPASGVACGGGPFYVHGIIGIMGMAGKTQLRLNGIVIIVGNYGSGKTEVTINLAMNQQRYGAQVSVADMDLVNPYFRTREAKQTLTEAGIHMVLPPDRLLQADLPILSPEVAGLIRNPGDLAILDAGGDDVGVTVLAALADAFKESKRTVHMFQVVNPFRPTTDSIEGCLKVRAAIEATAGMAVTGWVGNANMLGDTTIEQIDEGRRFLETLAEQSHLPLMFVTAAAHLMGQLKKIGSGGYPILPIFRQLVPPWQVPDRFSPNHAMKQ
jgi:hypothetical protein